MVTADKRARITGITGRDRSCLPALLLNLSRRLKRS